MASGSEPAADPAELGPPRPLREEDLATAVPATARAFAWREPWGAWVLPDEASRESTLAARIEADVRERFLAAGECWTIGAVCVTLWIPPPSEPGAAVFARRRSDADYEVYGDRGAALREADRRLAELVPADPHWYLDTIATDPDWHGRGLGGRLLDHDLEIRDAHGHACALDTHTAENVGFYRRRGFEVVASERLPDGGPDLHVMYRPPGG